MLIEQAIFTSTRSDRAAGYQLVARSPGISDADARELTVWGPSHDSLSSAAAEPLSVNYHPLPSGAHCVSRSVLAGQEYSHRRGDLVHTHCLLVDDESMRRFAHNPFNLLRAATALGALTSSPPTDSRLEPFRLVGRSADFDADALSHAVGTWPKHSVPRLVEAVLTHEAVAVCASGDFRALVAAVLQCLPVACRGQLSFATGLKPSLQRPYRLIALDVDDDATKRHASRRYGVEVVELDAASDTPLVNGWAKYVAAVLESGDWSHLKEQISGSADGPSDSVRLDELDELGHNLLVAVAQAGSFETAADGTPDVLGLGTADSVSDRGHDDKGHGDARRRAAARWVAPGAADTIVTEMVADPAHIIGRKCPDVLEELEHLDDMVFEAIAGKKAAIESLRELWPQLATNLPAELLDESRYQYLRHAIMMWRECADGDDVRLPGRAVAALDVVDVLFEQELNHLPD